MVAYQIPLITGLQETCHYTSSTHCQWLNVVSPRFVTADMLLNPEKSRREGKVSCSHPPAGSARGLEGRGGKGGF